MTFKRLPNNFGTITHLKAKLRKPWRAMKFVGFVDGKKKYTTIGYYESRDEAFNALTEVANKVITLKDRSTFRGAFEAWSNERYKDKPDRMRHIKGFYSYIKGLDNKPMNEITIWDIEQIRDSEIPRTIVSNVKTVLHGVFTYAIRHEMCEKDLTQMVEWRIDNSTVKKRKMFSKAELKKWFYKPQTELEKYCAILLYTGMRPIELVEMNIENVDIENRKMIGGAKTKAGKNRSIPIHKDILGIVKQLKNESTNGKLIPWDYTKLLKEFNNTEMTKEHDLYDLRHMFQTQCRECGIDLYVVDLIVGHKNSNITLNTYTHLSWDYILGEFDKLKYDFGLPPRLVDFRPESVPWTSLKQNTSGTPQLHFQEVL